MKNVVPVITLFIGILVWMPNVLLSHPSQYWLVTPLIGGVGAYLAFKNQQLLLMILNLIIVFSFPIVMFFGTLLYGP